MEGEKFSWFAKDYLRKRPRLESAPFTDDQMASTSACVPSTSSTSASTTTRRVRTQRILIEPSDEQLLKWQEKQLSKCIVENTLNQIVESYLSFIEGENTGNETRNDLEREAYHAYRAQENSIEDSAIVWAIDQYGLQQQFFNDNRTESMSTSSSSISLSSPPHLPSQDELSYFKGLQDANKDEAESKSDPDSKAECSSEVKEDQVADQGGKLSESATNEPHQSAVGHAMNDEHFDFMEAAVAVAIQEKGLVSFSMQQSPNR